MQQFKVAAQLYTLRNELNGKSKEEIRNVLKQVKEMGYNSVQISGVGTVDKELANTYKEICEELEIEVCATHLGFDFLEKNIDWVIEYHKLWNCKYVGIGSMPPEYQSEEGLKEFAKKCNEYGRKLKENGISLIYHNHRFEYEKYNGKTMMDHFCDLFEDIEFELDTHWVQSGGANPVEWIYKVDGRMGVIHFKDFRIVNNEQEFAEIGNGNLNWDAIIEACNKTGVLYAAIEQDGFTDDPIASLKMSIDFLKTKLSYL